MKTLIYNYLKQCPPAHELFRSIETMGHVYLIGGVLREYKDYNDLHCLRDIDVVLDTKDRESYKKFILPYHPQENSFGGYKINCKDLVFDIWLLQDTWAYREKILDCTPEQYAANLPQTVFLNIDGIVYDWSNDLWYDDIYQDAMKSKILDIVLPQNPQVPLNIIRAMILRRRYQMQYSTSIRNVMNDYIQKTENFAAELYQIQINRYKHEVLNLYDIQDELNSCCKTDQSPCTRE